MRFLVDAQLPPALAAYLIERGHDAVHVADIGLRHARDDDIWAFAQGNNRVIVSKDEDFALRCALHAEGPQVLWLRRGNSSTRALLAWLDPLWLEVEQTLAAGERLLEVI